MRVAILLLAAAALGAQDTACEAEAIDRWNAFVSRANRYIETRNAGVKDYRTRKDLAKQLEKALACDCF